MPKSIEMSHYKIDLIDLRRILEIWYREFLINLLDILKNIAEAPQPKDDSDKKIQDNKDFFYVVYIGIVGQLDAIDRFLAYFSADERITNMEDCALKELDDQKKRLTLLAQILTNKFGFLGVYTDRTIRTGTT